MEKATGNLNIKDEYIIYDKHKENLAAEYPPERDASISDDAKLLENFDIEKTEAPISRKVKENEVLGYGKSKSVIIKAVQRSTKKEVAIKEIDKRKKTVAQIEDLRDVIAMYKLA